MCYTTEPSPLRQSHAFFQIQNGSQRVAQQDKNLKSSITARPCKDCIVEWQHLAHYARQGMGHNMSL
jgi:hypothetical protein